MAERQIGHRKSCLVLSARFPVVNWCSRPVATSAYFRANKPGLCFGKRTPPPPLPKINVKINVSIKLSVGATSSPGFSFLPRERERTLETRLPQESGERNLKRQIGQGGDPFVNKHGQTTSTSSKSLPFHFAHFQDLQSFLKLYSRTFQTFHDLYKLSGPLNRII